MRAPPTCHVRPAVLATDKLTKAFGDRIAVRDLSIRVARGEHVALLGRNGAGKTTTLKLIAGLLDPTAGVVTIDGERIDHRDPAGRAKIGYVPDRAPLHEDMRVGAFLRHVARLRGRRPARANVARVVERCGIGDLEDRPIAALSHGHRQRVSLAQALVHEPRLLLLDEPAAGLDPVQIAGLRALLIGLREELTLILSSHLLGEVARIATRFVLLDEGEVRYDGGLPEADRRLRLTVEAEAGAPAPAAVLAEALDGADFTATGAATFLLEPAARGRACRALIEAGHELVALEPPVAPGPDELERLFGLGRGEELPR